jgi:putative endonuclease
VYLLESLDKKSWYIGFSDNLKRRLTEHNNGKGGKTTRTQKWKLIYFEGYLNKFDALGRERFLKSGSGRKFLKKQIANYLGIEKSVFFR